jgi:hypothetical protein
MTGLFILVTAVGLLFLISALANWDWYTTLGDFAVVESIFGENAARWFCGVFGLVLIGFGVVQLAGRH